MRAFPWLHSSRRFPATCKVQIPFASRQSHAASPRFSSCHSTRTPSARPSTEWELQVSSIVEQDEELMQEVRRLEEEYDNELLKSEAEET